MAAVSIHAESARAALTAPVAAACAVRAATPGARRTRVVSENPEPNCLQFSRSSVTAICNGSQTSVALGSGPVKPDGIAPTIV